MDQHTQVFYGKDAYQTEYSPDEPYYEENPEGYVYEHEDREAYPEETNYALEDMDEDYDVYEEDGGEKRFHVAMNMFDLLSVLLGIVTILVLTSLIVSIVSWFRTDIFHSIVLLQSRIQ